MLVPQLTPSCQTLFYLKINKPRQDIKHRGYCIQTLLYQVVMFSLNANPPQNKIELISFAGDCLRTALFLIQNSD